ncbi:MAG: hypothetical protein HYX41_03540 [Bdellovibrio sp.]|nr:hypothetical protein [Bdellovibrio sp.]
MGRRNGFFFWGLVCLFGTSMVARSSYAVDLETLYQALKDSQSDYEGTFGTVCEDAAEYIYRNEIYPYADYHVISRVYYKEKGSPNRKGELDLVIFKQGRVVEVVEVKCWDNLDAAHRKASLQRDSFYTALKTKDKHRFKSLDTFERAFLSEEIEPSVRFTTFSQTGGRRHGFDREMPFALQDMKRLSERIIQCQKEGRCRAAQRVKKKDVKRRRAESAPAILG